MNTEINNLKKYRKTPASLLFLSAFVLLNLAGCGGGVVGTGTGPTTEITDTYELKNLPRRISPDIPKALLRGQELSPTQPENQGILEEKEKISSRMDEINSVKSIDWIEMAIAMGETSSMRVDAEINSTIIDLAFDDIRKRCADNLIDCTIPGDQIKVKLTQSVINRFIELLINWVESLPPEFLLSVFGLDVVDAVAVINEEGALLLDSEIVLGETHYSQLDGAPYNHLVRTVLNGESTTEQEFATLFRDDQVFNARWSDDGNVAKFDMNELYLPLREYFYQNNTPSELVIASIVHKDDDVPWVDTHVRLIANDPNRAGVLVEFAEVGLFPMGIDDELTGNLADSLTQGQIDNDGGYVTVDAIVTDIADASKAIYYIGRRDSFDSIGNLIAGIVCEVRNLIQGIEICDDEDFESVGLVGSAITDSPYYFELGDFDSLVAVQDVIQWTVEGLPDEVNRIAVVSADPSIELSERELLCRGFQFVKDYTRVFCGATDEQLDNTVVLELVDGKLGDIIPTAKLVQIQ